MQAAFGFAGWIIADERHVYIMTSPSPACVIQFWL